MIGVELKYLIESGYLRIFDGVCQAIQKLEAMGCQPIKLLLRGTYCKSTNENASSRRTMCIYIRLLPVYFNATPNHKRVARGVAPRTCLLYLVLYRLRVD